MTTQKVSKCLLLIMAFHNLEDALQSSGDLKTTKAILRSIGYAEKKILALTGKEVFEFSGELPKLIIQLQEL